MALTRRKQSLLEELLRAWPPLGRGWLLCGRRSAQSLLEEMLRAWLAFVWQAQYTEPGKTAARVAAAEACGVRGRRWPVAGFRARSSVFRRLYFVCLVRPRVSELEA
jgi:hypothetical protein